MYSVDIKNGKNLIITLLCIILVLCIIMLSKLHYSNSIQVPTQYEAERTDVIIKENDFTKIIEKASEATVGISKLKNNGTSIFLNNSTNLLSLGTGIMISDNGYILTNQHVAGNKYNRCYVMIGNGREYEGEVLWSDSDIDLAILKINIKNAKFMRLGDSEKIKIGEKVFAIGNPIGYEFQKTVTSGIISGLSRTVKIQEDDKVSYMECMIQTDATINNGNSGGPLINENGEVIGVTTIKLADSEGMGFASPINVVKPIIEKIQSDGYFKESYMGIYGYDKDIIPYISNNISIKNGIYIAEIKEDSILKNTEIRVGDIILEIDGVELKSMNDLKEYIYTKEPGEKVVLKIKNEISEKNIEVILKEKIE